MLGKLLADSGGADEIVDRILIGGRRGLPWRVALIAFMEGRGATGQLHLGQLGGQC
ncbi:hypothetical protein [Verticiella sediminum]|uniref:hypothetical protein n=1 Tax=Verticiella sediminum TaxID=1247510 RepID=UPI0031E6BAFA